MKAALLGILLALLAVGSADGEVSRADVLRGCYDAWCPRYFATDTGLLQTGAWTTSSNLVLVDTGATLCTIKTDPAATLRTVYTRAERAEQYRGLTCAEWAAYLRRFVEHFGGAVGLCFLYDPVCGGAR